VSESCIASILISSFVGHGDLKREVTTNDMMFCQTGFFFHFGIKRYGSGECRPQISIIKFKAVLTTNNGEPVWDWTGPWCGGDGRVESKTADQANKVKGP
jgi:hypothetical protein